MFVMVIDCVLFVHLDELQRQCFHITDKATRNSKFRCLLEATSYHPNIFIFTLFLPQGRAGVGWEPNTMMLSVLPRKVKCLSLLRLIFSLHLLFGFKELKRSLKFESVWIGSHARPARISRLHPIIQL
jgi:hypothetical protein